MIAASDSPFTVTKPDDNEKTAISTVTATSTVTWYEIHIGIGKNDVGSRRVVQHRLVTPSVQDFAHHPWPGTGNRSDIRGSVIAAP